MRNVARGKRLQRLRGEARERAAREILSRWTASDLSQAAFCRQEGIASITLTRWISEFGRQARAQSRFVEARVRGARPGGVLEIVLPSGVRIEVPPGFDADDLSRLVGTLSGC
jgi:hypothetical protein